MCVSVGWHSTDSGVFAVERDSAWLAISMRVPASVVNCRGTAQETVPISDGVSLSPVTVNDILDVERSGPRPQGQGAKAHLVRVPLPVYGVRNSWSGSGN